MKTIHLNQAAPPAKPVYGEACNGCGLCCKAGPCSASKVLLGTLEDEPCPALVWNDGRYWCGVLLHLQRVAPPVAQAAFKRPLGIGNFCDAYLPTTSPDDATRPRPVAWLRLTDNAREVRWQAKESGSDWPDD